MNRLELLRVLGEELVGLLLWVVCIYKQFSIFIQDPLNTYLGSLGHPVCACASWWIMLQQLLLHCYRCYRCFTSVANVFYQIGIVINLYPYPYCTLLQMHSHSDTRDVKRTFVEIDNLWNATLIFIPLHKK